LEEAKLLKELLESHLSELRIKIKDNKSIEYREELKRRKYLINEVISKLEEGD
jgi:hypothetical protein